MWRWSLTTLEEEGRERNEPDWLSVLCVNQEVSDELANYNSVIQALHEQAGSLGEQVSLQDNLLKKNGLAGTANQN